MRFNHYLLLVLLILPLVHAISYDDKNTLNAVVSITNDFTLVPTSDSYNIKFVNASLLSYPRSDVRQNVIELTTSPETNTDNFQNANSIDFVYNSPTKASYALRLDAKVNTLNMIDEIKNPVTFPLTNLDTTLYRYIAPNTIIDVTPEIKNLASELIGDKTDLYEIEYTFAEYVRKHIAYDLGTITSDANQKSSWVLENKVGVCDEITNLFISLNRAAGVPTRFVSGIAYTNLDELFGKSWVSHAWAEVYYPGYGWIPYDVTYGQYGFVDAGHIKLMDSEDSSSSNVDYNYLGNNIQLKPGKIDINVQVLNYGENIRGTYNFEAKAHADEVGFGSYNLITVTVNNPKNYYQIADLYLSDTEGVEIIEESKETLLNKTIHRKEVLLKPYSSAVVYWMIKINEDLDSKYVYTMPITVYNTYNDTSVTFVTSRNDYDVIDKKYLDNLLDNLVSSQLEESVKTYSKYIYLECNADKTSMYLEDAVNIECVLDNKGEKSFESVNICLDDVCEKRSLAVQKLPLSYTMNFSSVGLKNINIKVFNDDFTKVSYIALNVLDKPKLSIIDLVHPAEVQYGEPFDMSFTLNKDSKSIPKNLYIVLKSETNKVEWNFKDFSGANTFTIKSDGSAMKPNTNNYKISVRYEDEKGMVYNTEQAFTINSKATFFEKILLYFNILGRAIEQTVTR